MEKYKELVDFPSKYPNIVVALGMFDGIHIGHQAIIRTAVEKAQEIKGTALVFSFANHPRPPPRLGAGPPPPTLCK